ncbi:hypothetical protein SmphiM6_23 [Sinorhizobium phage phiM6]|nr:hypothetical protein SmphiM6_23 [Sinorhizobium phage phiM6]
MISFFTSKLSVIATVIFLSGSAILGYGTYQYHKGYKERDLKAQVEIRDIKIALQEAKNKEVSRQREANRKAQEDAKKRLLEMQVEKDQLEKLIEDLESEANQDPDRDRIGLSAPSVMRINKVR